MRKLILIALALVTPACNWWPDYYAGTHTLRWKSNNVEFGRCSVGAQVVCIARYSQMVTVEGKLCVPTEPTRWCQGDPLPDGINAIYLVDY